MAGNVASGQREMCGHYDGKAMHIDFPYAPPQSCKEGRHALFTRHVLACRRVILREHMGHCNDIAFVRYRDYMPVVVYFPVFIALYSSYDAYSEVRPERAGNFKPGTAVMVSGSHDYLHLRTGLAYPVKPVREKAHDGI